MDDLQSEKEQIEEMRAWWSQYGNYLVAGAVVCVLGIFGFKYYQNSVAESQQAASILYEDLTNEVVDGDLEAAEVIAGQLQADHAESAYAAQASLAMARLYMDKNRDQDAADALRNLLAGGAGEEFKKVARLRLAKVLLYQGEAQEALDLLNSAVVSDAFAARYADARGDAYVALDRPEEARESYLAALAESAQAATIDQSFVQLKLQDLPLADESVVTVVPEATDEPLPGDVEDAIDEAVEEGAE